VRSINSDKTSIGAIDRYGCEYWQYSNYISYVLRRLYSVGYVRYVRYFVLSARNLLMQQDTTDKR